MSPLYFLEKSDPTFFSHRPLQSDDLFSCRLKLPSSNVVSAVLFQNSATFLKISFGCHLPVSPGAVRPPPPLVTPLIASPLVWDCQLCYFATFDGDALGVCLTEAAARI